MDWTQELRYDEENVEELELTKNKNRAKRRKMDYVKAVRKRRISRSHGFNWYKNLHAYSKNKVHCSCEMCRFKSYWNPNAQTYSDMKKNERDKHSLKEYKVE